MRNSKALEDVGVNLKLISVLISKFDKGQERRLVPYYQGPRKVETSANLDLEPSMNPGSDQR